ncbi:protease inhibitor Inh/omp19 family protein [Escherichia albertii]|uniref:protease inhibitor Inh/omp19 family protein n=1 Tax=Escherichia albertii TaxID=208962 RepID=UPI00223C5180|nr:protease inhibitor Inh/omp19 family protein [Escherichia albertii]
MYKYVLLAIILIMGKNSMATSLMIPSVESLSGKWTISHKSAICSIYLGTKDVPLANGYELNISLHCDHKIFKKKPVAWRPAPDGIAILDENGATISFFSKEGEHYRSRIWDKSGDILMRNEK